MAAILLGWTVTAAAAQPVSPNGKLTLGLVIADDTRSIVRTRSLPL